MITMRTAQPEDAEAIATVHLESRREAMPWLAMVHTAHETRWWIENIVLPNQMVWVAELDHLVVGIAAIDGHTLEQLYVLPGYQGRGIGTALLNIAMQAAGNQIELWTFQRNTGARNFYERQGFQPVRFTDGSTNEELEPDVLYSLISPVD